MRMKFSKYHGCGNDFICVDFRNNNFDFVDLAKKICKRHFSVGADGLVILLDSDVADYKMKIINADGSVPEMCGNGLRCFIHYINDLGVLTKNNCLVETDAGLLNCEILTSENDQLLIKLDIGKAHYFDQLPKKDFNLNSFDMIDHSIELGNETYHFVPISMGNPHAVIFVSDVDNLPIHTLGPLVENHDFFPNRVNVEFVQVLSNNLLKMRVWERGVGETNACGTGACASVVAATLKGYADTNVNVELLGGNLQIEFNSSANDVLLIGPSQFVFSSELNINVN